MSDKVGIWIDHKRTVIVSASAGRVTTSLDSEVPAHPHFGGEQVGGGEKKYEERRGHDLDRYYDEVINYLGDADGLLILGPGEAKLELKARLDRTTKTHAGRTIEVATTDRLTDPQIVAKVKEHFGID